MNKIVIALISSILMIYHSSTAQWVPQVTVLPAPNTASIAISVVDTNIVWTLSVDLTHFSAQGDPIGPMNRFARTVNGGTLWIQDTIEGAKGLHPGGITALDGQTAWVTMQDESRKTSGGIFKTTDGGIHWIKQSTAFNSPGAKPMFIYFFDPYTGLVVGERSPRQWEIYTTTNGGNQWDTVPQANIPPKLVGEWLREGFEFAVYNNTYWFCTSGITGRVFKSIDRGLNWTAIEPGPDYDRIHSIAFQDDSVGMACAFADNKATMIRTTDGGRNWFAVTTPTIPTPHLIYYVPGTSGSYVVVGHPANGNNTGSAITLDGGSSWTTIDNNSYGLLAFAAPNIGWAVGRDQGGSASIFRWAGKALITSTQSSWDKITKGIILEQNHPNPFYHSTKISYQIPMDEYVSLKVYDTLGKEVSTLVNEKKQTGCYEVEFRGRGLTGGIYFYTLRAGKSTKIKKMILLE